jgi:DNA polymerase-3 subunit epsilon
MSLSEEVVVLDIETTGFSPLKDRVIEVGAVILDRNGDIIERYQSLCLPHGDIVIPKEASRVNGITIEILKGQLPTAIVMEQLFTFIGNRTIVAHNAAFDSKFLVTEMKRIGKVVWNPFICTLKLSRRLIATTTSHKLVDLKNFIGFRRPGNEKHCDHRAFDDVLVTVHLFKFLMNRLLSVGGSATRHNTLDVLRCVSMMPKQEVLPFLGSIRDLAKIVPNDGQSDGAYVSYKRMREY